MKCEVTEDNGNQGMQEGTDRVDVNEDRGYTDGLTCTRISTEQHLPSEGRDCLMCSPQDEVELLHHKSPAFQTMAPVCVSLQDIPVRHLSKEQNL